MIIKCLGSVLLLPKKQYRQFFKLFSSELVRKNDQFLILKELIQSNTLGYSPEFVNSVKRTVFKAGDRINQENFDSLFLESCIQNNLYEMGKSFFHHLYDRNEKTSLSLIRKYFKLCFHFKDLCVDADKRFLVMLYKKVMHDYPALDAASCENLSMGLSITDNWLECLNLLQMSKEFGQPTNQLYSSIIKAAFDHGDESLGWKLLNEMMQILNDCKPHSSVYLSVLQKCSDLSTMKLFKFLQLYGLRLPEETAFHLVKNKGGHVTSISTRGFCHNCHDKLTPIIINESEFKILTEDFLNPVLIGKDIFIKTKPSELERFNNFLSKSGKVDVVLDGLNIAYAGKKKNTSLINYSNVLMNVVKHFVKKGCNIIVLGREHMHKWPTSHMNYIRNNASLFLTEDLSSDDPFLLFATMYSGLGTKFVSRDLMRGHKYLLKTLEKKTSFQKWQQKHQLFPSHLDKNGNVYFKSYDAYLMTSQSFHDKWHVPIQEPSKPGVHPLIQAQSMKWLCLQLSCGSDR